MAKAGKGFIIYSVVMLAMTHFNLGKHLTKYTWHYTSHFQLDKIALITIVFRIYTIKISIQNNNRVGAVGGKQENSPSENSPRKIRPRKIRP